MLKKLLQNSSATKLGYITVLLVILMAVLLIIDYKKANDQEHAKTPPGMSGQSSWVEKIVARLKGTMVSKRASGEDLAAFRNSGGGLSKIFSQYPEAEQAVVLKYLLNFARNRSLAKDDLYSLYDYHIWENGSLEKFWQHVFENLEEVDWEPAVYAFTEAVSLMKESSPPEGEKKIIGYVLGESNEVVIFGENSLFYLENAKSGKFQRKMYKELWALKILYYGSGASDLLFVNRQQEGSDSRPVNVVRRLAASVNLEKSLATAGESIEAPLPVHSLICVRDNNALILCIDRSLGYWERLRGEDENGWAFNRIAIADIETVFLQSQIRDSHVSLITKWGYTEFDNLTDEERSSFTLLERAVGGVNPGVRLEFPGVAIANRYYLYEFPQVVEYISRKRILEEGEVIVSLVVANTAPLGKSAVAAKSFPDGVFKWLTDVAAGLARQLGIGSAEKPQPEGPVSFAAVTDRRFFSCVNGEVKYYDLAEGIPFAIKRYDTGRQAVDFFERDFFDENKPLLDNVHETLVFAFQDSFRKVLSGNREKGSSAEEVVIRDKGVVDIKPPIGPDIPHPPVTAGPSDSTFALQENERGYAGMVKLFLEQGTFDEKGELLSALQAASGISDERSAVIREEIRGKLQPLFTIKPNEQGFAGMVKRFAAEGSLEKNAQLLEELASASGISEQRRKQITEWVLKRLQ